MRTRSWLVACATMALFAAPADDVVLNRDTLIMLPRTRTIGDLEKYIYRDSLDDDAKEDGLTFLPDDHNSGFEKTMTYKKNDGDEKIKLIEKSSRITSKRRGRAGPRDEETIKFKKVYRFELEGEKPRDVAMRCMEYTLSTKGGRS
jgi:hypothetical protein